MEAIADSSSRSRAGLNPGGVKDTAGAGTFFASAGAFLSGFSAFSVDFSAMIKDDFCIAYSLASEVSQPLSDPVKFPPPTTATKNGRDRYSQTEERAKESF